MRMGMWGMTPDYSIACACLCPEAIRTPNAIQCSSAITPTLPRSRRSVPCLASAIVDPPAIIASNKRCWGRAKMKAIAPLLSLSIIVAIIAFIQPFVAWTGSSDAVKDLRMLVPALFWFVLCVVGIIRYGRRGLWLFVGTPLALIWPVAVFSI